MRTAKIFKSGNSQAIRLPKEFQFKDQEVEIFKKDGDLIIREIPKNLRSAYDILTHLPDDFFATGRDDDPPQKRDLFE